MSRLLKKERIEMIHKLLELRKVLQQICHAPKCNNLTACPQRCGCRKIRKFKLNTETAMCWELAEDIKMLVDNSNNLRSRYKIHLHDLFVKSRSYGNLTYYHSTRGWRNLFSNVTDIIYVILEHPSFSRSFEDRLSEIKNVITRLKRTPK